MREVQYRRTSTLSDPFLKEAENLFKEILENGSNVSHAKFFVDYALLVCEWRRVELRIKEDNAAAIEKAIDLKEGVAEKLGIGGETLKSIAKMISNKDIGSLQGFYEQLIKFTKKKGERGEK